MPKPELYVIFTGNKGKKPDRLLLSKEFFKGVDIDIEVKSKVIYESDTDDIINQYVIFCKVYNEQTNLSLFICFYILSFKSDTHQYCFPIWRTAHYPYTRNHHQYSDISLSYHLMHQNIFLLFF